MTLAKMLSRRVAETGGNQAAYARLIGVTPQTLNAMLQGNIKVPNADSRRRIARDLGMRHVDLLVMLGELAEEEIASVAPRWPSDAPDRANVYALIEQLPQASLSVAEDVLTNLRDAAQWRRARRTSP